jgi:hypothetical protein
MCRHLPMAERVRAGALALAAALLTACGGDRAEHEVAVPWALGGQWLVADLHTHTKFSDGALTPEELVEKALAGGCRTLAITDHGGTKLKTATPAYFAEIQRLREKHKQLVLFAGMEWNIPPYLGREHVTILLNPALESKVLPEFRQRYDKPEAGAAPEAIKWLQGQIKEPADAVLIYNHPSRNAESPEQTLSDFLLWRQAGGIMAGFEGAPGHQRHPSVGAYTRTLRPEHRWDPVAATVGGVWDALLDRGHNVWAALASSDYHGEKMDHPPCSFSRTFVQVPERNQAGVLKALRAGTFWASHGRFLQHFLFTVSAPGLTVPASPGEVIRYRRGAQARVSVTVERAGGPDATPLTVELIGNCRSGNPELLATIILESKLSTAEMPVAGLTPGTDKESCYLRTRVRKQGQDGDDWLAYSNPVRIKLR